MENFTLFETFLRSLSSNMLKQVTVNYDYSPYAQTVTIRDHGREMELMFRRETGELVDITITCDRCESDMY